MIHRVWVLEFRVFSGFGWRAWDNDSAPVSLSASINYMTLHLGLGQACRFLRRCRSGLASTAIEPGL